MHSYAVSSYLWPPCAAGLGVHLSFMRSLGLDKPVAGREAQRDGVSWWDGGGALRKDHHVRSPSGRVVPLPVTPAPMKETIHARRTVVIRTTLGS